MAAIQFHLLLLLVLPLSDRFLRFLPNSAQNRKKFQEKERDRSIGELGNRFGSGGVPIWIEFLP